MLSTFLVAMMVVTATDQTVPVVPILLNCYYTPQVSARRSYEAGRALREIIMRDIGAFRDDEDMRGRLGRNVREGERVLVLVNLLAGNFAAQNFREDVVGIIHGC